MNPAVAINPPQTNSQYDSAFRRGNATSGLRSAAAEHNWRNRTRPASRRRATSIVPCMVNNSLYCSLDKNCKSPARPVQCASTVPSVRPERKTQKQVTRYMTPINLDRWSTPTCKPDCLWAPVAQDRAGAQPERQQQQVLRRSSRTPNTGAVRRDGRRRYSPPTRGSIPTQAFPEWSATRCAPSNNALRR